MPFYSEHVCTHGLNCGMLVESVHHFNSGLTPVVLHERHLNEPGSSNSVARQPKPLHAQAPTPRDPRITTLLSTTLQTDHYHDHRVVPIPRPSDKLQLIRDITTTTDIDMCLNLAYQAFIRDMVAKQSVH